MGLRVNSYVSVLESNMLGDNLRYAKEYRIEMVSRNSDLEVQAGFMGEGIWSDPNSAMEVNLICTSSCLLEILILYSTF